MSELWNNFLYGLAILLPGALLGAAIAYLSAGKPVAGPGRHIRRFRIRRR